MYREDSRGHCSVYMGLYTINEMTEYFKYFGYMFIICNDI